MPLRLPNASPLSFASNARTHSLRRANRIGSQSFRQHPNLKARFSSSYTRPLRDERLYLYPSEHAKHNTQPVEILRDIPSVNRAKSEWSISTGMVPTMGALHDGHLSLMREAAKYNKNVIVSIYVNPTQFGQNEDLANYPRTWDQDISMIHQLNSDLHEEQALGRIVAVFAPTTNVMYPTLPPTSDPAGHGSFVYITPLGSILEGASRPVFFRGVATVCMKLFNIIRPHRVYFGQKDAQQCAVIKRLVKDFHLGIEVVVVPTRREEDGLAMSSRNVNLGKRRRAAAIMLYKALRQVEQAYKNQNIVERLKLLDAAHSELDSRQAAELTKRPDQRALTQLDYISIADPDTMEEVTAIDPSKGAILSGALRMLPLEDIQPGEDVGDNGEGKGVVRLIDNIVLPPKMA